MKKIEKLFMIMSLFLVANSCNKDEQLIEEEA